MSTPYIYINTRMQVELVGISRAAIVFILVVACCVVLYRMTCFPFGSGLMNHTQTLCYA